MRILMLSHNVAFRGGGTFFIGLQIGQQLVRRGHAVTLVASSYDSRWRIHSRQVKGVRVLEMPGALPGRWRYGYDPYEVVQRVTWVAGHPVDIVHALESRPVVIYPALVAKARGAKLVMHWGDWFGRGGSVEQRTNPLVRVPLRVLETFHEEAFRQCADATTVINSTLEARALGLGVRRETVMRLPHVSDPESIRPLDRDVARRELGLDMQVPLLGYVGALFPADAALLVEAFTRVRASRPTAQLVLIGSPKTKIPRIDGIVETGFVSQENLNRYLAACDVLCLPLTDSLANRGRYPSKLADYFAAGRPTAACAVGDIGPVMQTAHAGLLSEPTSASLACQILALLDDAELRGRLGRNARQAAETYYNWGVVGKNVEALYRRLINSAEGEL